MFAQKQQQKGSLKLKIEAFASNNNAETSSDSMTFPQVVNKTAAANVTGTDESAMELTGADESVWT